jgi:hypothetical protein
MPLPAQSGKNPPRKRGFSAWRRGHCAGDTADSEVSLATNLLPLPALDHEHPLGIASRKCLDIPQRRSIALVLTAAVSVVFVARCLMRQRSCLGAHSGTSAMSDTFETYKDRMNEFREKVKYVEGAAGIAVAIGKKTVAVDLFDKPATCRKVWDRLMSGYVLDALEAQAEEVHAETADVERLVQSTNALQWQKADPVGEGKEYRAQQGEEVHASALALRDSPVHLSVVVAG